ncbi:MAG: winged helix-turn-helix transcriptional regulator [Bacteroidetes bacterium]|nr:winged helix-turn-helix transcriptional regulator [Bacteroidota bacterium]
MNALKLDDLALNALGDPTRRSIFEKLEKGPLSVVHIADGLPVTRSAVSQHLKVLKEARLITMKQEGTRSIYSINQEGLIALRNYLDRFWDEALENFKQLAETTEKQKTIKK